MNEGGHVLSALIGVTLVPLGLGMLLLTTVALVINNPPPTKKRYIQYWI